MDPLSPSPSPLSLKDPLPLLLGRGENQPTPGRGGGVGGDQCVGEGSSCGSNFNVRLLGRWWC